MSPGRFAFLLFSLIIFISSRCLAGIGNRIPSPRLPLIIMCPRPKVPSPLAGATQEVVPSSIVCWRIRSTEYDYSVEVLPMDRHQLP